MFVTGGGSGINLGIAKTFAALGAISAICGRTQEKLDRAAEELRALGAKVVAEAADVRDYAALERVIQATRDAARPDRRAGVRCGRELSDPRRAALAERLQVGDRDRSARLVPCLSRRLRPAPGDPRLRHLHLGGDGLHSVPLPGPRRRGQGRDRQHDEEPRAGVGQVRDPLQLDRARSDRGYRGDAAAGRRGRGCGLSQGHSARSLRRGGGDRPRGRLPGLAARRLRDRNGAGGGRRPEPGGLAALRRGDRGDGAGTEKRSPGRRDREA